MGNCLNRKPSTKRIFILMSLDLWPEFQTLNKVRNLLNSGQVDRMIIGCREIATSLYWNEWLRNNRLELVEYVVDPLLNASDYLLVLNKARPELNQRQPKVVRLLTTKKMLRDTEKWHSAAFLEHYPPDEWKITQCLL